MSYLDPGVYYIKKQEFNKQVFYTLEKRMERFTTPPKLYGKSMKQITRVWNEYVLSNRTTGVLYTGTKGCGKTLNAMVLSNIAIDNGIPVIMCVEIDYTMELIGFLSSLTRVVIFMDEFKKNMPWDIQDKALTMFSDLNSTNKLIVMTENSTAGINNFILNRPGRIRYHFDYTKLDYDVLEDYCKEYLDIEDRDKSFYKELVEKYKTFTEFSFDQLQAIVSEHLHYPEDDLDELLTVLNLHELQRPKYFRITKVIDLQSNTELKFRSPNKSALAYTAMMHPIAAIYLPLFKPTETPIINTEESSKLNNLKELLSKHSGTEDNFVGEVRITKSDLRAGEQENQYEVVKTTDTNVSVQVLFSLEYE